jgi:hypothetical protein
MINLKGSFFRSRGSLLPRCIPLACSLICLLTPLVWAQSTTGSGLPQNFPRGTWDLELAGSYAWEFYPYDHEKIAGGAVGVGYYPADNFAVSLRASYYHFEQFTSDANTYSLDLSLRYHFLEVGRFTLFGDLIGGISQADKEVPPGGTYFNFTLQGGIGATYRVTDHLHLMGGVRIFHLSNAAIESINRNPDLNAGQIYLGALFTF